MVLISPTVKCWVLVFFMLITDICHHLTPKLKKKKRTVSISASLNCIFHILCLTVLFYKLPFFTSPSNSQSLTLYLYQVFLIPDSNHVNMNSTLQVFFSHTVQKSQYIYPTTYTQGLLRFMRIEGKRMHGHIFPHPAFSTSKSDFFTPFCHPLSIDCIFIFRPFSCLKKISITTHLS